jgi:hypothetical protein
MRRPVAILALSAALVLAPGLAGVAQAGVAGGVRRPSARTLAAEVCEDMVRNALAASLGTQLPGAQQGSWAGNVFTCLYPLPGGQFVLRVNQFASKQRAHLAFTRLARAARGSTRLNGIGDRAFQARDGILEVWKDQFVLDADPSAVPPPIGKSDLAFAAVVAVMGCW